MVFITTTGKCQPASSRLDVEDLDVPDLNSLLAAATEVLQFRGEQMVEHDAESAPVNNDQRGAKDQC